MIITIVCKTVSVLLFFSVQTQYLPFCFPDEYIINYYILPNEFSSDSHVSRNCFSQLFIIILSLSVGKIWCSTFPPTQTNARFRAFLFRIMLNYTWLGTNQVYLKRNYQFRKIRCFPFGSRAAEFPESNQKQTLGKIPCFPQIFTYSCMLRN